VFFQYRLQSQPNGQVTHLPTLDDCLQHIIVLVRELEFCENTAETSLANKIFDFWFGLFSFIQNHLSEGKQQLQQYLPFVDVGLVSSFPWSCFFCGSVEVSIGSENASVANRSVRVSAVRPNV
jgi:hypothetical protein